MQMLKKTEFYGTIYDFAVDYTEASIGNIYIIYIDI